MNLKTRLKIALKQAKQYEESQGKPCYVEYWPALNDYCTTTRMPMLGEWYSTDGVRHGG